MAFAVIRDLIEQAKRGLQNVKPIFLQVNGAAGTGKSFFMNIVKEYAKQELGPNFIKAAAPSGTAAFLIGGETLHGMLSLPVGKAKLEPLQGERLQALQNKFSETGIIMIDEKSMVGQKLLYHVSSRLQEANPHKRNVPFGGFSIILLGYWRQLSSVGDSQLYSEEGKERDGLNLYRLFNLCISFEKIERQAGDEEALFREELNRLGEGNFTREDWRRWRSRTLDLLPPDERQAFYDGATLACALKKDSVAHNIYKIKSNNEPIALIKSVDLPKRLSTEEASDRQSGLLSKLILCRKASIRLNRNLWTKMGLTNGAAGYVHAIIYEQGHGPPELPTAILAVFPHYTGPSYLPHVPRCVPIVPVRSDWWVNGQHHSRLMLPIILGYALSINKLQGATMDKIILNPGMFLYLHFLT